jgi:Family of unknown function (DUF6088)
MPDVKDKIIARIRARGRGRVYVAKDFLDIGGRAAVDQVLSRMAKEGTLRRLGRGLYDYPKRNARLGVDVMPETDRVAEAIARKRGCQVQRSGAVAANGLGLTTQVPGKDVYMTDSTSAKVPVGKRTLTLKHAAPKGVATRDKVVGSVLQALYFLGKNGISDDVITRLRGLLSAKDKQKLLKQSRYAVGWLADAVQRVALEEG